MGCSEYVGVNAAAVRPYYGTAEAYLKIGRAMFFSFPRLSAWCLLLCASGWLLLSHPQAYQQKQDITFVAHERQEAWRYKIGVVVGKQLPDDQAHSGSTPFYRSLE